MNIIKIINRNGNTIDEFETKFEYEVGEIITVNSDFECKCKDIICGLKNKTYVFVKGWIEFGF